MDTNELPTQAEESIPSRDEVKSLEKSESGNQSILPILIGIVVLILVGLSVGIFFLAKPDTDTARIRDIFIIFMALESLLIGIALVILLVQIKQQSTFCKTRSSRCWILHKKRLVTCAGQQFF